MEEKKEKSLATKLVSLRKQKGLTQMNLAERLNVSRQAISRWEVGAAVPSMDNLKVLGELYGVQVDYLLNDDAECESKAPEIPREDSSVQEDTGKRSKNKSVIVCILVIVITIAVLICAARLYDREADVVTPIVDMDIESVEDNPDGTFDFD